MNSVRVLATGPELIKEGTRGIESVIEELILEASSEIQIMAYVFTPRAMYILDRLEEAALRGVKIRIIVNRLESQNESIKNKLCSLKVKFDADIIDFSDKSGRELHAKVVVVDRRRAVIGSANFSMGGMVTNYEVGVLVEGDPAWTLAKVVDSFASYAKQV